MILYTPLSQADIFPHSSEENANRHFVTNQGRSMYVEQQPDGSYQLLRLLSSDPHDFLKAEYTPGTLYQ